MGGMGAERDKMGKMEGFFQKKEYAGRNEGVYGVE